MIYILYIISIHTQKEQWGITGSLHEAKAQALIYSSEELVIYFIQTQISFQHLPEAAESPPKTPAASRSSLQLLARRPFFN